MSFKLLNLEELRDSREMLEKRSPAFISWFLILLTVVLAIALIWSWKAQIDIVVKAPGVIKPNERISKIINKATGSVSKIYVQQGQQVHTGDKLFSIQTGTLKSDRTRLQEDLKESEQRLTGLEQLSVALSSGNEAIKPYTTAETLLRHNNSLQNKLELDILKVMADLVETDKKIANQRLLLKSLNYGKNYLASGSLEYERYENHSLKASQNSLAEAQIQEDYKRAIFNGDELTAAAAKEKLKTIKLQMETSQSEFRFTTQSELEDALQQKETLKKQKSDLYVQLQGSIEELKQQQKELNTRINTISSSLNNYTATAPTSGVINIINEIGEGQLIQEGLQVLDIVPIKNTIYSVQIAMNQQDVGRIHEGDTVRFHFAAFPREEYGSVLGKVASISSDALINPQNGSSYYMVEANLESIILKNILGQSEHIKSGMQTEAYIITEQKSALKWLLEKMDFWTK
ncbi:HlyD family efflux transporter periplasmic adaptor subunit [Paenibacillus sp. RRE4]|uniref:HlyD family efflux transporter periplasmic adaptor subunit n=1 Tax=Paenibacillus sp. RRE4 TaxID=2962587 RepID=UPI00288104E1|nr:HlyD family efflux transporter periplasmic adaptor subunit [Paenibacillus sp. RRE4]MDT0124773.1 HlyD family efflux transporter periplasmic adaptor subunit [Paenibacillus sp. RRE4]